MIKNYLKFIFAISILILVSCGEKKEKVYDVAQIITPKGDIYFWLYDETPNHKKSFIKLANQEVFDGTTFNRVIKGFFIQGGCPDTPEGFGGSPYLIKPEFNDSLTHIYGAVGAGRDENDEKLSAGCQIYIVQKKDGTHFLDNNYTVFGQVFKGMDIVELIANEELDSTDTPINNIDIDVNIIQMTDTQLGNVFVAH